MACHLCGANAPLQNSHVIPAFVFRWLRETSGTGHIRRSTVPNLRVQDGPQKSCLCRNCEQNFGRSETAFATQVFHPYLEDPAGHYRYGSWLLHFCVSVSWRTLHWMECQGATDDFPAEEKASLQAASSAWRDYLLGAAPHPGQFRQHIFPLEQISHAGAAHRLSPNINRFLMRAVVADILHGDEAGNVAVLTKLGRFAILGFAEQSARSHWAGSGVAANGGTLGPRNYTMPMPLLNYFNAKADGMADVSHAMSSKQRAKIDQAVMMDLARMRNSDFFKAMSADVEMFGAEAFHDNQRRTKD